MAKTPSEHLRDAAHRIPSLAMDGSEFPNPPDGLGLLVPTSSAIRAIEAAQAEARAEERAACAEECRKACRSVDDLLIGGDRAKAWRSAAANCAFRIEARSSGGEGDP